jgi:hypothetical protein
MTICILFCHTTSLKCRFVPGFDDRVRKAKKHSRPLRPRTCTCDSRRNEADRRDQETESTCLLEEQVKIIALGFDCSLTDLPSEWRSVEKSIVLTAKRQNNLRRRKFQRDWWSPCRLNHRKLRRLAKKSKSLIKQEVPWFRGKGVQWQWKLIDQYQFESLYSIACICIIL